MKSFVIKNPDYKHLRARGQQVSRYRARAEQVVEPADRRFARARKHDAAKLHEKHGEELIYLHIY